MIINTKDMSSEEKFMLSWRLMTEACQEKGWGQWSSYARCKEIYAAIKLGHQVAKTFSGADAINKKGQPVEYKSTTGKNPKGAYTGVSVYPTWAEQEKYLKEEKIAKYPEHYYNRFDTVGMCESWMIEGPVVHEILLPKFKKKFPTVLEKKDPRLSATVTWAEIQKYGKKEQ